jgi:hypothetical protein
MRASWEGYFDKLEPIPVVPHANLPPHVVNTRLINEQILQAVRLGNYIFLLGIGLDGFNPWRGIQYCMWLCAVKVLNLKVDHLAKTDNLITLGIISGPREPKTLQHYLSCVVQDVLFIQANQVTVTRSVPDGHGKTKKMIFRIMAFIVAIIGDYPALTKILNMSGTGT